MTALAPSVSPVAAAAMALGQRSFRNQSSSHNPNLESCSSAGTTPSKRTSCFGAAIILRALVNISLIQSLSSGSTSAPPRYGSTKNYQRTRKNQARNPKVKTKSKVLICSFSRQVVRCSPCNQLLQSPSLAV